MLYQLWIFSGLFLWYGDLWDSHIIPVTTPSSHSWCPVHHHVTSMECLVGKRLVAALCLIHVRSVSKARQSAPYGLCKGLLGAHVALLLS